ncbi:M15 family metallopeptidase [Blastochloris tepida]|uniref:Peptidase M15C domain-containing protein n=1 Tax=Blastochloris tepida TaxID=2233851 RepID=A0A348FYJ3_9HYPH|nr:M15 family metallopeptidase [Blastochloris tepida]BBF92376.1 hypothetical protein BLTE_10610 [Blastochloris tepida]
MSFQLTERDRQRLAGVHPDLVRVVERAAELCSRRFMVVEGVRSTTRQRELKDAGKSKTMNSRHLAAKNGFGHAVDLVVVEGKRTLWDQHAAIENAMKRAARELGVPIEWGGDWKGSWDSPHWQLPWRQYPARAAVELKRSRTVQGSVVSAGGGLGLLADQGSELASQMQQADGHISSGTVLGAIIGAAILAGALYALYARWDDAGRPLPDWWPRRRAAAPAEPPEIDEIDEVDEVDDWPAEGSAGGDPGKGTA